MKCDNILFHIENINPRPAKKFVYRFDLFVALSLPFAEQRIEVQGQRRKEKQARGRKNPSFPRTNRSRAPTTSSRAVLAPPSTPIGFARQPSCIPTYMYSRTARILNRALYCSASPIIAVLLSESVCTRVRAKKSGAEILPRPFQKVS